ncbi:Aste57867_10874 [Aphanomyces stellatus]|uniref:Aste57867_10874 protein n=1 Tax=Aphanomyces stellatus TaxID=120398 RepID=A0A485KS22_9STRA|nr:hypothetical protein As57867_010834 [Aphanomyces stellatus]VFT87742.1 Aste57867_10874 [Aphanomyces stellatus]
MTTPMLLRLSPLRLLRTNIRRRRLSSKASDKPTKKAEEPVPFFMAKQDTLTTRLMGSDWGDRRGQPVSFSMKVYWTIFGFVIVNGVYAHYTGKDEFELYHDTKHAVKELLFGKDRSNEHVIVAQVEEDKALADQVASAQTPAVASEPVVVAPAHAVVEEETAPLPPLPSSSGVGLMSSQRASAPSPLFGQLSRSGPRAPRVALTKEQLTFELQALRDQERQSRAELRSGSLRDMDVISAEIREIEALKAELKRRLKAHR